MSLGSKIGVGTGHRWHPLPSKMVVRRWCSRCGCLAEGEQRWARKWPPVRWDWQFSFPGNRPKILRDAQVEPPCPVPYEVKP